MGLPRGGTVALRGLHLLVLSAFGVAQPLFDLLGDTPEFFVVRGSTTADIVVFALAVVFVPPALLLAVEALASAVDARAGALVHLLFVALLAAIVAVQALKRVDALPGTAILVAALALGGLLALLYARQAGVRSVLTVLGPAPVLFLALFLVNSPLDKLSLESDAAAGPPPEVTSTTPVVLVVFDELAVTSLLDERGRVDAERFPAFAELAADSTFFSNAATVHEHTTESVPAILSGRNPRPAAVPLLADHPDNLFTWLGASYSPHVLEPVTQLCPTDVCPRARESFGGRMASLGEDLGLVYLHVLLPEDKTGGLPSVTQTWQDFGDDHGEDEQGARPLALRDSADIDRAVGRELWRDQRFQFEQYVRGIKRTQRPGLFFFHSMLTHSPWRFLPSGRVYSDSLGIEGISDDRWADDRWLVAQGWQRHLLQVGFADRMFGLLLDRLRSEGIYDRALIVVTADHGISFVPGERRRGVTPENVHDIASVPLFVKRPGQGRAQVVDRHVQTTDIVPTVADVLGTPLPYEAHGQSLFDPANDDATVTVEQRSGREVTAAAADVARRKEETVRTLVGLFGSGRKGDLFAIGPHRDLLGRTAPLRPRPAADLEASLGGEALLAAADPESPLSPAHLTGRLTGARASAGLDLALAVNGRIAAVARSYETGGDVRFSAFAPDRSFRAGANHVDVYAVNADGSLELLGGTREAAGYSLVRDGAAIATPQGTTRVAPALEGAVEDWYLETETVRIGGWAGDVQSRRPATTIVVFDGDELVYSGTPGVGRADLAKRHPGLGRSGFVVELPRSRLEEDGVELRFFALRGEDATELPLPEGFPWKPAA